MSADGVAAGSCAAYGCPLLGSFGVSGKWYCCCHFRGTAASNDAITSVLVQHREKAERAVYLRRTFAGYKAILAAENELIELTREIGKQYDIPAGGVTGPTHAEPHFSETDA
ncbi:hypothetical protein KDX27_30330 [Burkholderia cenocepacia]|uniref:hypothetical protein n=1 Tax=Burkholderia cenocepacia TaxID=95486 RepID=UPI001B9072D4|nr:hypothetical protein [Burkholderia cenocepacia]MBR7905953.1 hypothetical protein [Burkholderia cenocepacia]MBR8028903.1 hypothetical protein [Burkholderia cenocepacia]MBR8172031.1 hypothetical protein [Burkholderia cenocepacia]MBR8426945.1 hypothetical protein [Burkholderia cenocepacia]